MPLPQRFRARMLSLQKAPHAEVPQLRLRRARVPKP
jgi:hypothetical protein